jgi:hypothetical protein
MLKVLIIGLMLSTGTALAEIYCLTQQAEEAIEVKIIDTFLDRSAFVTRTHPTIAFPRVGIPVISYEKSESISFINIDHDFNLTIEKFYYQRRLPLFYRAYFFFGGISIEMHCTVN